MIIHCIIHDVIQCPKIEFSHLVRLAHKNIRINRRTTAAEAGVGLMLVVVIVIVGLVVTSSNSRHKNNTNILVVVVIVEAVEIYSFRPS